MIETLKKFACTAMIAAAIKALGGLVDPATESCRARLGDAAKALT